MFRYTIFIISLFVSSVIFSQNDSITINHIFDMTIEELMEQKVTTAAKTEQKISDIPASVVVLEREKIKALGYRSFTEILEHISGMYYIEEYFWLSNKNYGVRGFYSNGHFNNMVILVNGVSQLSDKYSDYPDVKINVPVEAIERIEIIKGPMSVMYGSGAFFGAINIITNSTKTKHENQAIVGYGSNSTFNSFFRYGDYKNKIKFSLNGGFTKTKGIDVPFSKITTNANLLNYVGLDSSSTTGGQLDDARKYISASINVNGFFSEISFSETQKDIFDAQPSYGNGSEMSTYATNIALGYKRKLGDNWDIRIQGGYYNHSHHIDYSIFKDYYYEIDNQRTSSADVEIQANGKIGDNITINLGLLNRQVLYIQQISDFHYYGLDYGAGEIGLPRGEQISNSAAYTQFTYSPIDKIDIIAGARVEHYGSYNMYYTRGIVTEDSVDMRDPLNPSNRRIIIKDYIPDNGGFNLIPRFALLYKPNHNSVIKLMYGKAIKQPSFSENYRQLPNNNPQLHAAKIETYEINGLFSITRHFNLSTSIFYNKLEKLISVTNTHNTNTGEWEIFNSNSGKQQTIGAELGTNFTLTDAIIIELNGMYQKSNNLKDGYDSIPIGYSPNLLLYGNIRYAIKKNITIAMLYRYIGSMKSSWVTESMPSEGYRLGANSPQLNIIDANFRWANIQKTGIFVNAKIQNLLNTEIRYPTTNSNQWVDKGALGINRSVYLSIGYDF